MEIISKKPSLESVKNYLKRQRRAQVECKKEASALAQAFKTGADNNEKNTRRMAKLQNSVNCNKFAASFEVAQRLSDDEFNRFGGMHQVEASGHCSTLCLVSDIKRK